MFGNRVNENLLPVILLLEQGPEILLGPDQSVAGCFQPTGAVVAFLSPLCAHLTTIIIRKQIKIRSQKDRGIEVTFGPSILHQSKLHCSAHNALSRPSSVIKCQGYLGKICHSVPAPDLFPVLLLQLRLGGLPLAALLFPLDPQLVLVLLPLLLRIVSEKEDV